MAQLVEHVLGKDEVTGSNPVISSIKTPFGVFFYFIFFYLTLTMRSVIIILAKNTV